MIVIPTKNFEKKLSKSSNTVKIKFKERIRIFMSEPHNIILNNHKLHGKYTGYRSINITGNYRLIFEEIKVDTVRLVDINTHPELYG